MTAPVQPGPGRKLWENIGFLTAAAVAVYLLVHAFDPPRLNWGDSVSDYNALTAGRNFARYGFLKLRLTPLLLDRSVMTAADQMMVYTHYPQLPDLMNGVFRVVLRLSELWQFRIVALAFSFGALFFVYRLITAYWSRQAAQVSLALWVLNPMWIQHADYLHHGPYGAFFGFGSLYFLHRSWHGRPRAIWLSGLFLLLTYFSSYDTWIFIPLLLAAMTVRHYGSVSDRRVFNTLGFLASFAFAAIGLKLATNAWALGGVSKLIADLRFQFSERATEEVVQAPFARGIVPTLLGRMERNFSFLLLPIAVYWAAFPLLRSRFRNAFSETGPNPGVLLLAALPFLFIFRELWVAYYYPALLLVPFWAAGSALAALHLLRAAQSGFRIAGAALLLGLAVNAIDENWRFPRAFFPVEAIESLREQLPRYAPAGQRVLVDHAFDSHYRYYFDRNIIPLNAHEAYRMSFVMRYFSDPRRPQFASPAGAIYVHHKHLREELFDKGYYHMLARYQLWEAWGNPPAYRRFIDSLVAVRDSQMLAQVAMRGQKVYETDYYALWRLRPAIPRGPLPP